MTKQEVQEQLTEALTVVKDSWHKVEAPSFFGATTTVPIAYALLTIKVFDALSQKTKVEN
jgi:hypothetical protein